MTFFDALFLGIMQGLTEFLPVSSSGHLVLLQTVLDLQMSETDLQAFDVILHAATACAILYYYRSVWIQILQSPFSKDTEYQQLFSMLVVATIPAGIIGVVFGDVIAENFRSVSSVALFLSATAVLLIIGELAKRKSSKPLNWTSVLIMGVVQSAALLPGISRSGITITGGQLSGLSRRQALDFSFQMALPAILGALVLTLKDVATGEIQLPSLSVSLVGFFASFIVSTLCLIFLRSFVSRYSLVWFSLYLIPVSLVLFSYK